MEITQVKVFPVYEDKLKAFVSVVFDHCFMVNDIKVIQGKDGLFLSMPSRRKRSGEFKDVAHPLNHETRRLIELRVLDEYRSMVDDQTPRRPDREAEESDAPHADDSARATPVAATPFGPASVSGDRGVSPGDRVEDRRPAAAAASPHRFAAVAGPAVAGSAVAGSAVVGPAAAASSNGDGAHAASPEAATAEAEVDAGERTLEEVQEAHLRDSFWSVS